MRLTIFLATLVLSFSTAKAEYLVPKIHKDRFLGKSSVMHVLNFESITTNGHDRDCIGNCVLWVFENAVLISGDTLITGYSKERNKDIPMRMRFDDEILSFTCKLTQNAENCIPTSTTISNAALAKKIRDFVGGFAIEFVQEMPGANRYRRDVWAARINGIAPKKDPNADEIDYSGLHGKGDKK